MILGWLMRRVAFPLAFWWQMRKARRAARFEDELDDDVFGPGPR